MVMVIDKSEEEQIKRSQNETEDKIRDQEMVTEIPTAQ